MALRQEHDAPRTGGALAAEVGGLGAADTQSGKTEPEPKLAIDSEAIAVPDNFYDPEVRPAPRKSPHHNPLDDACGGVRLCAVCRKQVDDEMRREEVRKRTELMRGEIGHMDRAAFVAEFFPGPSAFDRGARQAIDEAFGTECPTTNSGALFLLTTPSSSR